MPNIELKAKTDNFSNALIALESLNLSKHESLHQIDTYFKTLTGRLKLREINGKTCFLIPYKKEKIEKSIKSNYTLLDSKEPKLALDLLTKLLGVEIVIDKKRDVFLFENVRIHLDEVKDFGTFIEFEAVYEDESSEPEQLKKIKYLKKLFKIKDEDLLDKSYIDYLL